MVDGLHASSLVQTTGAQTISGAKTLNDGLTVKAANGAYTAMMTDGYGRVIRPSQPAFLVQHTPATGISGNGLYTIGGGSVSFNVGGHYNNGTYRFTAPAAGMYYFAAAMRVYGMSSAAFGAVWLRKNAVNVMSSFFPGLSTDAAVRCSGIIELAIGDYVDAAYMVGSGGGTVDTTHPRTYFCGYQL